MNLINEVHWCGDDSKHSGNETSMRYVQRIAHIIEGRSIIKLFRNECPRCRYLNKSQLKSLWAQHLVKISLLLRDSGPYNSYSKVNKRAMFKVWFVIFCCVTGAVDVKVIEDYSTSSFILAFIRFSCEVVS